MNENIVPISGGDFAVVRSGISTTRTTPPDKGESRSHTKPRTGGEVTIHPNPGNLGIIAQEKR